MSQAFGQMTAYTQLTVTFNSGSNSSVVVFAGLTDQGAGAWIQMDNWSMTASGPPIGKVINMLALADNLYVCADNAGSSPLIANRSVPSTWESFLVVDRGGGNVAFQSQANGLFVCADNGGASPLIANRTAASTWETFRWIDLGGGNFALQSLANGLYVCADNAGASPLIANRTAIGQWETFHDPVVAPAGSAAAGGLSSTNSGGKGGCGLTGLEIVIVLGLLALRRRRA